MGSRQEAHVMHLKGLYVMKFTMVATLIWIKRISSKGFPTGPAGNHKFFSVEQVQMEDIVEASDTD